MSLFFGSLLAFAILLYTVPNAFAQDSAAWEQALVDAWATIGDCQPSTGMCSACGFGKFSYLRVDPKARKVELISVLFFVFLQVPLWLT